MNLINRDFANKNDKVNDIKIKKTKRKTLYVKYNKLFAKKYPETHGYLASVTSAINCNLTQSPTLKIDI